MKRAAGILFHAAGDRVLLMHRTGRASQDADHRGDWAFPGGGIEGDETPEQTARRECREETGLDFKGELFLWTRRIAEGVEFTTFLAPASEEFTPVLNDEHDAYQWVSRRAALGDIQETNRVLTLHPGCKVALERFDMDELAVAKAMRDGELASPQRYMNMLLCDIRITGTGYAYRSGREEFAWRDPAIYMNQEFLERCNGLPVVVNHPPKNVLDSDEYKARVAGAVFLPYLRQDTQEVWAIVKIHDMDVADDLESSRLSTSPGVAFKTVQEAGERISVPDGRTLLIEGKPSLLDHIALCSLGVWDKGGPPAGVSNQHTETVMADATRTDADEGKLDKILDAVGELKKECDAIRKDSAETKTRMDSFEKEKEKERADSKARADAEEKEAKEKADAVAKKDAEDKEAKEKADAQARKDAEEKEEKEKKEKADAQARADAAANTEVAQLRKDLAALSKLVPAQVTQEVRAKMVAHTVKAEPIYQAFGDSAIGINAPSFVAGESERDYAIRLLTPHLKHSKRWKDVNLEGINDSMLAVIENDVYHDAMQEATRPTTYRAGVMIPQRIKDAAGREITRYAGDPNACWDQFNPRIKYAREGLASFKTPTGARLQ